MYVVTEADAAAIREVYERDGELSAAIVSIGMQKWLWRKVDAQIRADHTAPRRRALSKSRPARPYIWRLTSFSFVFCPSVWPFDHGSVSAALHRGLILNDA